MAMAPATPPLATTIPERLRLPPVVEQPSRLTPLTSVLVALIVAVIAWRLWTQWLRA